MGKKSSEIRGRKQEDDMESDNVTILSERKAIALIKGGLKNLFSQTCYS